MTPFVLDERGLPVRVWSAGTGIVHAYRDCPHLRTYQSTVVYRTTRTDRDRLCRDCLWRLVA